MRFISDIINFPYNLVQLTPSWFGAELAREELAWRQAWLKFILMLSSQRKVSAMFVKKKEVSRRRPCYTSGSKSATTKSEGLGPEGSSLPYTHGWNEHKGRLTSNLPWT